MARNPPKKPVTEEAFRLTYEYDPEPTPTWKQVFRQECTCTKKTFSNVFPIVRWLPKYRVKAFLLGDVISGLTVAVMHIPHGLSYAQLGNVPPVVGLYMAVYPVIVYVLMASCRHTSLGTFAVLCGLVGDVVDETMEEFVDEHGSYAYSPKAIGSCICLVVGFWQIILWLLRLSSLTVLFSKALVSGFTAGAAVHVVTYQFKNLLGINLQRFAGPLKLVHICMDLFKKIHTTNIVSMIISICCVIVLFTYNFGLKPYLSRKYPKCTFPLPVELMVVVIGILLSYFLELNKNYGVKIVGDVPAGLPTPQLPPLILIPHVLLSCLPLAIVAIAINLSLANILAQKEGDYISVKQEILGYGASNIFASFFECLPVAASLSRSFIQFSTGGKTQLASAFSVSIIVFILLFMGPLFEPVPYCVLSSIVLASISSLLLQIADVPRMFRLSYLDGLVWVITFISIVLIDIVYGLVIGFAASALSLFILNHYPQLLLLGEVQGENLYLEVNSFNSAREVPGLAIIKVIGAMNFANDSRFQHKLLNHADRVEVSSNEKYEPAIILDMGGVMYIDPTATDGLLLLWKDLERRGVRLFLAGCNSKVYNDLEHCEFFKQYDRDTVFATVGDAVEHATKVGLKSVTVT